MTVLMFGWEFPPHISGGLGTACSGLTKALLEENVGLIFVVPKAHGDESIKLVSASDILMGERQEDETFITPGYHSEGFLKINVASPLSPYRQAGSQEIIQDWSWEFPSHTTTIIQTKGGHKFEFTGKYGPALLDEVQQYSEVASAIAGQYSFDIIHAHDWLTFLAGIEAKRTSGKPLIIHVHGTEFDRAGAKNIDSLIFEIEKKGMQEADMIIAVSQWTKDIIVSEYGIDEAKVRVVHNGVTGSDVEDFSLLPKLGDQVVTFLGRMTYQKGPQYFIEAARRVVEYFPDAHFIMAGSGDLLPAMIDRVAQLKLSSRIHFTGFLSHKQIHQVWAFTNVYVMPSVSEPFGITPLEAVMAGIPVIVSNQSGVAEVIHHAIKVDFWDTEALANSIIGVLKHKALSDSLKENSKLELELLTWQRAAKIINRLYHELQNAPNKETIS